MASDSNEMPTLLREILHKLSNIVTSTCDEKVLRILKSKSEVLRQSTRSQYGDICIPRGVVEIAFPTIQEQEKVVDAIQSASESLPLPILSCSSCKNGFISIHLQRPSAFKRVISDVVKEGAKYGHQTTVKDRNVVLTSVPDTRKSAAEGTSLATLRQHLVSKHVSALLEANGYRIYEGNQDSIVNSSILHKILGKENQKNAQWQTTDISLTEHDALHPKIAEELSTSKYVTSVACQTDQEVDQADSSASPYINPDGVCKKRKSGSRQDLPRGCRLNLVEVLEDQKLKVGRGGYSQNLSDIQLTDKNGASCPVLQQCSRLQYALDEVKKQATPHQLSLLHISPSSHEFTQQKTDLSLRAVSTDFRSLSQFHLSCAPVNVTMPPDDSKTTGVDRGGVEKKKPMDLNEFYTTRESQMREASVLKYGDQVQGDSWNEMIETLTCAGIKFDILGTHFRHQVKLDVGDMKETSPWRDTRNGVFVVYNYARLSNIFTRFEEEVQKGTYPPLPPVASVDFSALKEEAEWKLLCSHLLAFPDVVADSVKDGFTTQELSVKFETQKVCNFLISMSQDLSAYYSRFRVLMEPRPHLLPTIHARLYLLKAVHQVLRNGMALLGITPLTQM